MVRRRSRPRRTRKSQRGRKVARPFHSKKRTVHRAEGSSPELEKALRFLRAGNSQRLAAKSAGVSVKRFRQFLRKNRLAVFRGRKWHFTDKRRRRVTAITTRGEKELVVRGFEPASWAMSHRNAVRQFVETPDASLLKPFEGVSITDIRGQKYTLETRPNFLYRLAATGGEPYEQVYRLVT
jgi:hypothetical protein